MKLVVSLFSLFLLSACLLLNDASEWWDKGYIDTQLIGSWKAYEEQDNSYVTIFSSGPDLVFRQYPRKATTPSSLTYDGKLKTVVLDGLTFLLVQIATRDDTGYFLIRYTLKENMLQIHTINLDNPEVIARYFPDVKSDDLFKIARMDKLDGEHAADLVLLFSNPANYTIRTYSKIE